MASGIGEALDETRAGEAIYFVDDAALSGTQTLNYFSSLLGHRRPDPCETVLARELSAKNRRRLVSRIITLVYHLVIDSALDPLSTGLSTLGLNRVRLLHGIIDPIAAKALEPTGPRRVGEPRAAAGGPGFAQGEGLQSARRSRQAEGLERSAAAGERARLRKRPA